MFTYEPGYSGAVGLCNTKVELGRVHLTKISLHSGIVGLCTRVNLGGVHLILGFLHSGVVGLYNTRVN